MLQAPPTYKITGKKQPYAVPEFYGFEHKSTKWMLTTLSSRNGLQRLAQLVRQNPEILTSYYQIPDRPKAVSAKMLTSEQPAFNHLAIMYVTPLALAIYLKNLDAVKLILRFKNFEGKQLVHPTTPCFVQKLFKKGDFKLSNDLSNTYPAIIAIRRKFFDALSILMICGYKPQKEFSIIYRRAFREVVTYYRDIVDYVVDMLRTKPGIHLHAIMNVIMTTTCKSTFDVFTYDLEETESVEELGTDTALLENPELQWVSVFRRITRLGVNNKYYNEESGMALITILEFIQKMGFFRTNLNQVITQVDNNNVEGIPEEGNSQMKKENTSPIKKITNTEMMKINETERDAHIEHDRYMSVGILVYWYQIVVVKRRPIQKERVEMLLTRILLETGMIQIFFDNSDNNDVAEHFTNWSEGAFIRPETVALLKMNLPERIASVPTLMTQFTNKYQSEPTELIMSTNVNNDTAFDTTHVSYTIKDLEKQKQARLRAGIPDRNSHNCPQGHIKSSTNSLLSLLKLKKSDFSYVDSNVPSYMDGVPCNTLADADTQDMLTLDNLSKLLSKEDCSSPTGSRTCHSRTSRRHKVCYLANRSGQKDMKKFIQRARSPKCMSSTNLVNKSLTHPNLKIPKPNSKVQQDKTNNHKSQVSRYAASESLRPSNIIRQKTLQRQVSSNHKVFQHNNYNNYCKPESPEHSIEIEVSESNFMKAFNQSKSNTKSQVESHCIGTKNTESGYTSPSSNSGSIMNNLMAHLECKLQQKNENNRDGEMFRKNNSKFQFPPRK